MLGEQLEDPEALEGGSGTGAWKGAGLLPIRTRFGGPKTLRQRTVQAQWPAETQLDGFELHHGQTWADPSLQPLCDAVGLGWWTTSNAGGQIVGTYLHGLLDNGAWRRHWLNGLRQRKGLTPLSIDRPHHGDHRHQLLDRLADAFEDNVDLGPLLA